MKVTKLLLVSLLLTLGIWSTVSWPLPLYTFSGIPASHQNTEKGNVRDMIAGDHLQFLYHMWLAGDTFFGPTPLFANPYEFNHSVSDTREDTRMRYYLPFTLAYSLFAAAGPAAGWNGTGLVSLWLTFLFAWLLVRRYTDQRAVAYLAAAVTVLLPYRWIALLGGSPTGLAMMWAPIAFYGLDVMVRDRKAWGGALAGLAIFLSGWSDPHVTFFTVLAAPCWCILCYVYNEERILPTGRTCGRLLRAAVPLLVFAVLVVWEAKGTKSGLQDTAVADEARRLSEVAIFSPAIGGLWGGDTAGKGSHIYVGVFMSLLLAAGLAATAWRAVRGAIGPRRVLLPAALLFLGIVAVLLLATGVYIPIGGALTWQRLCKLLPPYGMIRQPAKIFIILPPLMAVFLAVTLPHLLALARVRRRGAAVCALLALALLFDYGARIDPTVCRLDPEQGAYAAIARDAAAADRTPLLLAIPLWPGDSHWTSLYQYYVSRYRIRMVNGYRPTVRKTYFEDIYRRFESVNQGGCSDAQLDEMARRGVDYLVLHEDAFPEKVSPFAVSQTLYRLLAHPRIRLLAQDGPVWAFKCVPPPHGVYENLPDWKYAFPSRIWQAEQGRFEDGDVVAADDASGGSFLRLTAGATAAVELPPYPFSASSNLSYLVRLRGGTCRAEVRSGTETVWTELLVSENPAKRGLCRELCRELCRQSVRQSSRQSFQIPEKSEQRSEARLTPDPAAWSWHRIAIPPFDTYREWQPRLVAADGSLDIDLALPSVSTWPVDGLREPLTLPAALFFHAGHTELETGAVILRARRDPADVIFYGPKLPLPAGRYAVTLDYDTDAPDGVRLGLLSSRYPSAQATVTPVIAGRPAVLVCEQRTHLRFAFDFRYSRNADMRIRNVTIEALNREAGE